MGFEDEVEQSLWRPWGGARIVGKIEGRWGIGAKVRLGSTRIGGMYIRCALQFESLSRIGKRRVLSPKETLIVVGFARRI